MRNLKPLRHFRIPKIAALAGTALLAFALGRAAEANEIPVGNLVDFTGRTASVGKPYGQAKIDAANWLNANGGIGGTPVHLDTYDYAYEVPRAIAKYKEWAEQGYKAIQGWGTADTQALARFTAEDHIPYFSASYSGLLTDPQGKGPHTQTSAPYNFIMGPSYSDSVRALLEWAKQDWSTRKTSGRPKYVHMGDDHPYPNAPKRAGETYARELGFDVVPAISYSLVPKDFAVQCEKLKTVGADYAFLANTSGSNIALLTACARVGVEVQFLSNIWGFDENVMRAAGRAANGVVWVMGAAPWTEDVAGMQRVHDIAKLADPNVTYQPTHYIRGICSFFFMKDAMASAKTSGTISGPAIKRAMYRKQEWSPTGLDGVCPPGLWTPSDHRGFNHVRLYQSVVSADSDPSTPIPQLINEGIISMHKVFEVDIPRKPEWLGW